ncbi:Ger(x)C family spore germination protein [Clostridium sp. YIM B02515]|uniref:Ger(X)C family spore germination protein n=1 Tax=Clostridium rhizosphaerae TaxID=2803861 RepID=A0ABS1TCH3_9CLOT|nr:Ger(x)C family spore germination protein [Clostridium rhizosphaerae]MBL4937068.1 Ger(x)C family spore germination protein [Clostridium rhizosphaerae]
MKKSLSLVLINILILCSLTGCDFKDIDHRVFILAIGIDLDPSNSELMRVSLKAAMPTSGGESSGGSSNEKGMSDMYTLSGDSLSNILREIKSETSFEPDFSQMKLIVFGEQYAKTHNIDYNLDFFTRRRDFQDIAWVSLGVPSAKAVLTATPKEERIPGNSLFLKFGQGSESPYSYKKRLFQIYSDTITPGCSPSCSIIETKEDKLAMNKTAIISKGKLALVLNENETETLNLLTDKIRLGSLTIKLEEKGPPISISINKGSSKIKIKKTSEGDILCTITPKINATLEELDNFSGNASVLAPKFEVALKKQITALLDKLKENKVDPLQLQMLYWANDKNYMPTNDWLTDIYPNIKFEVNPHIELVHTGILRSN